MRRPPPSPPNHARCTTASLPHSTTIWTRRSAFAIARETLRAPVSEDERRWLLLDFDYVLGLDLDRVWATGTSSDDTPAEVRELVEARAVARNARDFTRADALRDELATLGWDVVDGPDGSQARPKVATR